MSNRKAKRHFKKMHKQTIKQMHKIIKDYGPWDYSYLLQIIKLMLIEMEDYYKNGYNVVSIDENPYVPNQPTRYEIAAKMLQLYNEFENCNDIANETAFYHNFWNYFVRYITYLWD